MAMEDKDRIFCRKIEAIDCTYRIQTTIGIKCLCLDIIQEIKEELLVYKTSMILEQNLARQAEKLGMNVDVYFEKLIYFIENPSKVKFDFNKNTLTIIADVNSHIQVKYFQCDLEKVSNSYIGTLIDDLHSQKLQSEIECEELRYKNEFLQKDVVEYKNKLNELVDRKIVDEKTMLTSFVLLLNEKKTRIQHLQELLETFRNDSTLADPVEVNITYKNKRKLKTIKSEEKTPVVKEAISESESNDSHPDSIIDENLAVSIKSEETCSKYSDIFNESPTDSDLPLAKFPKLNTPESSIYNLPSTSTKIHSNLKLEEDKNSSVIQSQNLQVTITDTQEWIDNL